MLCNDRWKSYRIVCFAFWFEKRMLIITYIIYYILRICHEEIKSISDEFLLANENLTLYPKNADGNILF